MRKNLAACAVILLLACMTFGQSGTLHGVNVTWTASTGSDTAVGYNVYRCVGTCLATSGTWTKIDAVLDISTGYLDISTGLTAGTTYSYAATAVDANGNESAFSNVAVVPVPSAGFPPNPNAPSSCSGKVQ